MDGLIDQSDGLIRVVVVPQRISADGADRAVVAEAQALGLEETALAHQFRHQRCGYRFAQNIGDAGCPRRSHLRAILRGATPVRPRQYCIAGMARPHLAAPHRDA